MLKEKVPFSLNRELSVLAQLVRWVIDAELRKISNLSSQQIALLSILRVDKVVPRDMLMRRMGVYGDSFDDLINPLVEQLYILDEDIALEITQKGEAVLEQVWPLYLNGEELLYADFSQEEITNLQLLIKKIKKNARSVVTHSKG